MKKNWKIFICNRNDKNKEWSKSHFNLQQLSNLAPKYFLVPQSIALIPTKKNLMPANSRKFQSYYLSSYDYLAAHNKVNCYSLSRLVVKSYVLHDITVIATY